MAIFLFQPHVAGPQGNITTPDVAIDRVFVNGTPKPLNDLTSEICHQVESADTAVAAYAVTALGGGALLSPAIILSSGRIVVARKAWRLNNLDGHVGAVTLNGEALNRIGLPADAITQAGGDDDTLPRGYMVMQTGEPMTDQAELKDSKRDRALDLKVILEDVGSDRWGPDRPKPRYAIGPTKKEIPHFI